MGRTNNTLFMLTSLDWKISTWAWDNLDFDIDLANIQWVKEWLYQYYEEEQKTDIFSLCSWKVMQKIWMNNEDLYLEKTIVSFIIIDSEPHLTKTWIKNLIQKSKKLFLVTSNKNHPAFLEKWNDNLEIILYEWQIDFNDLFSMLKEKYNIENVTIQTWWTLNSIFLRNNLIYNLSIIVAPILIGWKDTPSLIDWESFINKDELLWIRTLKLESINQLNNSYIYLKYKVRNN